MTEETASQAKLSSRQESSSSESKSSEHPSNPSALTEKTEICVTKGGNDRGSMEQSYIVFQTEKQFKFIHQIHQH